MDNIKDSLYHFRQACKTKEAMSRQIYDIYVLQHKNLGFVDSFKQLTFFDGLSISRLLCKPRSIYSQHEF